jgi:hypothetical protein
MTTKEGSRTLILQMGISLDGFVAVPSGDSLTPVIEGGSGLAGIHHSRLRRRARLPSGLDCGDERGGRGNRRPRGLRWSQCRPFIPVPSLSLWTSR